MRLFFICVLSVLSLKAFATTPSTCLDQKEVAAITPLLKLTVSGPADVCASDSHYYKVLDALILLKNLQLSAVQLPPPLDQHIVDQPYFDYFVSKTQELRDLPDDDAACTAGFYAYATTDEDGTRYIGLCSVFYDFSAVRDLPLLLHERRHFDGFPHVTCSGGQFIGMEGGCDEEITDKGAYAVSVETGLKIAFAKNISASESFLLKADALSLGEARFNQSFSQLGMQAIYLVSQDHKHAYFVQENGTIETAAPYAGQALSRTFSLVIIPDDQSDIFSADMFNGTNQPMPSIGGLAAQYNSTPQDQRPHFITAFNDANGGYVVFGKTLSFANQDIALPWEPTAVFSAREIGQPDVDAFFVRNEKNEMLKVEIDPDTAAPKLTPIADMAAGFKAFVVFGSLRLGLRETGEVQVFDATAGWQAYAPLKGQRFSQITRPFAWTADLWKK